MNINHMTDAELGRVIAGRCVTNMAAVDLAKFIRQCVKDSQKELVEALRSVMYYLEEDLSTHCCLPKYEHAIKRCQQALASAKDRWMKEIKNG